MLIKLLTGQKFIQNEALNVDEIVQIVQWVLQDDIKKPAE
jgi:hypothetical protein